MTPELQAYAETDKGFLQFCDRCDRTTSDPQTRIAYHNWQLALLREEGIKEGAVQENNKAIARSMLLDGFDIAVVTKHTKISDSIARHILADLKI